MILDFNYKEPEVTLKKTSKRIAGLSISRLVLFFSMLAIIIVGLSEIRWVLFLFFPVSILFVLSIKRFNKLKDRQAFLKGILAVNDENHFRKVRDLSRFDQGTEFIDKKHPFSNDLDLFGEHSLFQLLNHTVSGEGRYLLAQEMKAYHAVEKSQLRHSAIQELSTKKDFLLHFEAFGKAFLKEEKAKTGFYEWINTGNKWKDIFFLPIIIGPIVGLAVLLATIVGYITPGWFSLWVLIGAIVLSWVLRPLMAASKVMPDEGDLKTYTAWARLLEGISFQDEMLQTLQKPIYDDQFKASNSLKSLEQQSFMVQNRANLVYMIFNFLFWTDYVVLWRLERWKKRNKSHVHFWETCFNEWQVLVSLAAFTEQEGTHTPVEWTSQFNLKAQEVKHPLIHPDKCVANDFELKDGEKIVLLTGSNMSGKTTFMRTIGINLVLAGMGLSPFAKSFATGPFQLFTSMRNTDSLGESVSSFYAELARIKKLLDQAESGLPIFFLLDEILKGTNTTDRVMGSEALINQLRSTQSKGIISTHDIELADLEIAGVLNFSFHSTIQQDEIIFDYKIKKGPCPSFNAHKLMELMGIKFN
ncbi:DNA mismatch repair protein [Litoribacter alkaliphilus]|uniref:DNA mismatch repair protein n=1 Tax=Litoribacter ruber TaxID=702568 RepID=A0AAP2CF41_9BACT|nr:DNA mismatch repair protein [Litoribacter alkaliphilus]MBS9523423.1 DNA mismatch repair protein [Litoribacter alkaliphilus]